jgi:leucyl aminopeptidase
MIRLTRKKPGAFSGDLVAYLVRQPDKGCPDCDNPDVRRMLQRAFDSGDFTGKEGQMLLFYPEKSEHLQTQRVLIVGLGKEEINRELFRKGGGSVAAATIKTKARRILVVLPEDIDFHVGEMAECISEGLILGSYRFEKYKTVKNEDNSPGRLDAVTLYCSQQAQAAKGLRAGVSAAMACLEARNMACEPGNKWRPTKRR